MVYLNGEIHVNKILNKISMLYNLWELASLVIVQLKLCDVQQKDTTQQTGGLMIYLHNRFLQSLTSPGK